jgi:CRISPR-associated endonuclease/helicase Cas3
MSTPHATAVPTDQYFVGGAGLPATKPGHQFPYREARRFQRATLDWIHADNVPPVSAVAAPTGGGKTAVIAALADAAESGAVCTYPTNALIEAQATALREVPGYDLSVETVTGRTLTGTGNDRSRELLEIAQNSGDVVVTNPDVLQAIIQDAYFSPGGRILAFFEQFDAAVFDEFHYYDPLAASGLLLQIRMLARRGQYLDREGKPRLPRVLLTSATPDEDFVAAVTDDFGINTQIIRSRLISLDLADPAPDRVPAPEIGLIYTPAGAPGDYPSRRNDLPGGSPDPTTLVEDVPEGVSRFRYPMLVNRWNGWIGDAFEAIAGQLKHTAASWSRGREPIAAVVFNSAARSNAFDSYLHESWPELASKTRKDNGYDTNADIQDPTKGEYAVLNTTSKGEVGLDFDLERLIVSTPQTATALIQRVGRAARQSPAIVDLYGLDDPTWPPVQSYAGFLSRILDLGSLPDPSTSRYQLRELAGLRAGRAIQQRISDSTYHSDVKADFESIPGYERWNAVLRELDDAEAALDGGLGTPTVDASGRRAIRGALEAVKGLDTLRGRSVTGQISYPIGHGQALTEYDISRALRHYPIDNVDANGVLHLGRETPTSVLSGTYPGEPFGGLNLRQGNWTIENRLTDAFQTAADAGDFRQVSIGNDALKELFGLLPLQQSLLPEYLNAGRYRLTIDRGFGEIKQIDESP